MSNATTINTLVPNETVLTKLITNFVATIKKAAAQSTNEQDRVIAETTLSSLSSRLFMELEEIGDLELLFGEVQSMKMLQVITNRHINNIYAFVKRQVITMQATNDTLSNITDKPTINSTNTNNYEGFNVEGTFSKNLSEQTQTNKQPLSYVDALFDPASDSPFDKWKADIVNKMCRIYYEVV